MIEITNNRKRLLLRIIDNMFKTAFHILFPVLLMRPGKTASINKILLIRLDHIGDVAMISPVPRLIKEKYPKAKITIITGSWAVKLAQNNPYIDEVICHDAPWWASIRPGAGRKTLLSYIVNDYIPLLKKLKKERFDIGMDFRGDLRHILLFLALPGVKYRIGYGRAGGEYLLSKSVSYDKKSHETLKIIKLLNLINIAPSSIKPEIYVTDKEKGCIEEIFKTNNIKDSDIKIILSPGARVNKKRWPLENFIKLGELLEKRYGAWIIFTGISAEIDKEGIPSHNKFINLIDKLDLLQLTALFEKGNILISNDSGAAHIASSTNIPIVALFGPTDPDIYKPASRNLSIIIAPEARMDKISIEQVMSGIEGIL